MAKIRSVKFNFVMNSILTASSILFPLITFPYVSRILLPAGTGVVSFANSVVTYFAMFAQLGIPTYGIRACAQVRDDREKLTRTVQEILLLNLIMTVIVCGAFLGAVAVVPRLRAERTLYLVMGVTILFNTLGVEWLYKGLEQYTYITVRSVLFKFLALVGMLLLVHQQGDYVIYGGLTIFAATGSNLLNFINLKKYVGLRPVGGYQLRRHIKPIGVFFAMSVATTIYTNLDNVMLGFMTDNEKVGFYDAAVKIKNILVNFVASLGTVLLPRMSYYIEHKMQADFQRVTKKALQFVFLLALPLTVYFMLFARESILLLSGSAYLGSVVPMQIIMPTILLIGLTNIMGIQMLVPLGREKTVLYSEIAGAVVDVVINLLLIPKMGAAGAAAGTLAAECVVFLVQFAALRGQIIPAYASISYWKTALSVLLAVLASGWVKLLGLNPFASLAASACLFFGVYLLMSNLLKIPLVRELEGQVLGGLKEKRENR